MGAVDGRPDTVADCVLACRPKLFELIGISLSDTACSLNVGVAEDFIDRISSFGGEVTRVLDTSSRDARGVLISDSAFGSCSSGIAVAERDCVVLAALLVDVLEGEVGGLTARALALDGRAFVEALVLPVLDVVGLDVVDMVDLDVAAVPEAFRSVVALEVGVLVRGVDIKGRFEVVVEGVVPSVVRRVLSWAVSGAAARRTGRLFSSPSEDMTADFRVVDAPGRAGGLLAVCVGREDMVAVARRDDWLHEDMFAARL